MITDPQAFVRYDEIEGGFACCIFGAISGKDTTYAKM